MRIKPNITIIGLLLGLLIQSGCTGNETRDNEAGLPALTYTCSMHPQIVQNKPGTCPICAMDLVVFDKSNKDPSLTLSTEQQLLANVVVQTAGERSLNHPVQLNGRITVNPAKTVFISSRVAGRIEKLYMRETGVAVQKGNPLYSIYSEQLLALQNEFIVALAQLDAFPKEQRFQLMADAAAQKLFLYDQELADVEKLRKTRTTNPIITFRAPASGTIAALNITEGMYVQEGSPIMKLEDYSSLWVEADVYPGEVDYFKAGQQADVSIPAVPGQAFKMKIELIIPALAANTQLMQIRGSISNASRRIQPGMQALVSVIAKDAPEALMLPVNAVIRDGQSSHIWINNDSNLFVPRMVKTGIENADYVQIAEGLEAGERVVISGAYLLYSEYILKKGTHPVAHNHYDTH